ncbi:MAG TPA: hypothetical protein VE173_02275, partial [Longimicrobiales bacterium]|nr:hypothetical protein [Longimicrobiales bacterium]
MRTLPPAPVPLVLLVSAVTACGPADQAGTVTAGTSPEDSVGTVSALAGSCEPDNDGLTLPDGFCAIVFHPGGRGVRHLDVRDDGAVFVAVPRRQVRGGEPEPGGILVLRDRDDDGRADAEGWWGRGVADGNEVLVDGETVWVAPDDAVLRYSVPGDGVMPSAGPDTVVGGLPADRNHTAKSVALGPGGALFVNIGAPSNACQQESRTAG